MEDAEGPPAPVMGHYRVSSPSAMMCCFEFVGARLVPNGDPRAVPTKDGRPATSIDGSATAPFACPRGPEHGPRFSGLGMVGKSIELLGLSLDSAPHTPYVSRVRDERVPLRFATTLWAPIAVGHRLTGLVGRTSVLASRIV